MKKFKVTITAECSDEWYNKQGLAMKLDIDNGNAQKELMSSKDKREGMENLTMTFEDITE